MQKITEQPETYNGWTNYATWGVALVLDNDEGTYNYVREHVAELRNLAANHPNVAEFKIWTAEQATQYTLEEFLRDHTEELCGLEDESDHLSLMARQVIQAGMSEVNWREIAENILSES